MCRYVELHGQQSLNKRGLLNIMFATCLLVIESHDETTLFLDMSISVIFGSNVIFHSLQTFLQCTENLKKITSLYL